VRFSEAGMTEGVEEHEIDGVPVRITNVARTVADCFKYRNKIGLDVASGGRTEGGTEGAGAGRGDAVASIDELWRYARLDRVANVMRPYLESLA
jgi:hypothetical protein